MWEMIFGGWCCVVCVSCCFDDLVFVGLFGFVEVFVDNVEQCVVGKFIVCVMIQFDGGCCCSVFVGFKFECFVFYGLVDQVCCINGMLFGNVVGNNGKFFVFQMGNQVWMRCDILQDFGEFD